MTTVISMVVHLNGRITKHDPDCDLFCMSVFYRPNWDLFELLTYWPVFGCNCETVLIRRYFEIDTHILAIESLVKYSSLTVTTAQMAYYTNGLNLPTVHILASQTHKCYSDRTLDRQHFLLPHIKVLTHGSSVNYGSSTPRLHVNGITIHNRIFVLYWCP